MILVLDDEEILVDLLKRFLEMSGIPSIGFSKAEEAIHWYKEHAVEIEIAVIDLNLGALDGLQVLSEFRTVNPNVRAVLLSGASGDQRIQDLSKLGIEGFFNKPLKYPELVMWIKSRLIPAP